jgi:tartrate-resistant acid phosphatase type 5
MYKINNSGSDFKRRLMVLVGCVFLTQWLAIDPQQTAAADPVRFGIIGDYGGGTVEGMLNGYDVDFMATAGDNSYGSNYTTSVYNHYGDFVDDELFYATPGNHDYDYISGYDAIFDYLPDDGHDSDGRYYDVVEGPVHIFLVDSTVALASGNAMSVQKAWLEAAMATSISPWQVVLMHHPPYSSGGKHGSEVDMQWDYAGWGADAVIGGHDHHYERVDKNGIPYFVNGAGGHGLYEIDGPVVPGSQVRVKEYGAQIIDATDTEMRFRFINVDGTTRDDFTITQGPPILLGDLDLDDDVDAADWTAYINNMFVDLSGLSPEDAYAAGDINHDGFNNKDDFVFFKQGYNDFNGLGAFEAAYGNVPEPGTLALMGLGGLMMLKRRRNA